MNYILRSGIVFFWLAVYLFGFYNERLTHFEQRFSDFTKISDALERYKKDHGKFPLSSGSVSVKDDWIPELVPKYLVAVPRDPRFLNKVQNKQYLYISDGIDYKLIVHAPEDFGYVSNAFPKLVDPRRSNYAYGLWTTGASRW